MDIGLVSDRGVGRETGSLLFSLDRKCTIAKRLWQMDGAACYVVGTLFIGQAYAFKGERSAR